MLVCDRMSSPAVTVSADIPFEEALKVMRNHHFRRLPVVDKRGRLVGIVSERDLLHAAPSSATLLSVWEAHQLLVKIPVKRIMTREVITATPDTPVEDAAHLMVTHRIGGLPVVGEHGDIVGVITETDVFKTFVEMFAGGQTGLRLTLEVPKRKGVLSMLSSAIFDLRGSIESVGFFNGKVTGLRQLVIKVREVSKNQLVETVEGLGGHVVDVRDV